MNRAVDKLNVHSAEEIALRPPMGFFRGNQAIIASTLAIMAEFPVQEHFGQDGIWFNHTEHGHLGTYRIIKGGAQS